MESTDFDLTKINPLSSDFFVGFTGGTESGATYYITIETDGTDLYIKPGTYASNKVTSYTPNPCALFTSTISQYYGKGTLTATGNRTIRPYKDTFIDYVVDKNPLKYPNDGQQGRFWYEKCYAGNPNIDYGTVTVTNSTPSPITVYHNLGVVPKRAILFPMQNVNPSSSLYYSLGYLTIEPYYYTYIRMVNSSGDVSGGSAWAPGEEMNEIYVKFANGGNNWKGTFMWVVVSE